MTFPVDSFVRQLNVTPFVVGNNGETAISSDWKLSAKGDISRTYYSMMFVSSLFKISLSYNVERIITCSIFSINPVIHQHAQVTLIKVMDKMNFDCFFVDQDHKLLPTTSNTANMLSWISPLYPYLQVIMVRYKPELKFPFLRHDLDLEFCYSDKRIDVYYFGQKLTQIYSIDDAEAFLNTWYAHSAVFEEIIQESLELALTYDSASFLRKNSYLHFFSKEFHLGFSYYQKDHIIYYFTALYSKTLGRMEKTETEPGIIREYVLSYLKKLLLKSRTDALFDSRVDNYFYKMCVSILEYDTDFSEVIVSIEDSYEEIKRYVNKNHSVYSLEKLPERFNPPLKDYIKAHSGFFQTEHDKIIDSFEFGDYYIVYFDYDGRELSLYFIRKSKIKKLAG